MGDTYSDSAIDQVALPATGAGTITVPDLCRPGPVSEG